MKAAAEAGDRASRADSRTSPNLVLGASLLLPLREVLGALTQLRDRQLDRGGAGVELPGSVAIAAVDPLLRNRAVGSATDRVGLSRHHSVLTNVLSSSRSRSVRRWHKLRPHRQLPRSPRLTLDAREDRTLGRNTCSGECAGEGNRDPCLDAHLRNMVRAKEDERWG